MSNDTQENVIQKVAQVLRTGGKLLFTAPYQKSEWEDVMTRKPSKSLGAEKYKELLSASGLTLIDEFEDRLTLCGIRKQSTRLKL